MGVVPMTNPGMAERRVDMGAKAQRKMHIRPALGE
jgi:hypothetical protein